MTAVRIAMLTDCYLPRLGGIEVQVHDLTAQLLARGHEVEVFTITPGGVGHREVEVVDGVPVHRLGRALPRGLLVDPTAGREVRRRLGGFDVAHIHMGVVSPFAVDCAAVVASLDLPAAMTWHCVLHRAERPVAVLGAVRRWARAGMAMSAVSRVAAEPVRRIVDGPPVTVLPNGIDAAAWRLTGRPLFDDGVVRVITAMRLAARKRPVELVEAVARVRTAAPRADVRLEILGDGPDRGKVERAVARLGAQAWVTLAGRVSREQVKARYAASDIYVSPAVLESFGIAALEARTAGLPVVARAGSGVSEFVTDDVNGYLAADDAELVARLTTLAVHPAVRARMSAHNRRVPPEQDWSRVVERAEGEYTRALAGR